MKLFWRTEKYVFRIAGSGSICPDGFRVPYTVYKRVFPFVYIYLGTCWLAHWDTYEDIMKWVHAQETKRR